MPRAFLIKNKGKHPMPISLLLSSASPSPPPGAEDQGSESPPAPSALEEEQKAGDGSLSSPAAGVPPSTAALEDPRRQQRWPEWRREEGDPHSVSPGGNGHNHRPYQHGHRIASPAALEERFCHNSNNVGADSSSTGGAFATTLEENGAKCCGDGFRVVSHKDHTTPEIYHNVLPQQQEGEVKALVIKPLGMDHDNIYNRHGTEFASPLSRVAMEHRFVHTHGNGAGEIAQHRRFDRVYPENGQQTLQQHYTRNQQLSPTQTQPLSEYQHARSKHNESFSPNHDNSNGRSYKPYVDNSTSGGHCPARHVTLIKDLNTSDQEEHPDISGHNEQEEDELIDIEEQGREASDVPTGESSTEHSMDDDKLQQWGSQPLDTCPTASSQLVTSDSKRVNNSSPSCFSSSYSPPSSTAHRDSYSGDRSSMSSSMSSSSAGVGHLVDGCSSTESPGSSPGNSRSPTDRMVSTNGAKQEKKGSDDRGCHSRSCCNPSDQGQQIMRCENKLHDAHNYRSENVMKCKEEEDEEEQESSVISQSAGNHQLGLGQLRRAQNNKGITSPASSATTAAPPAAAAVAEMEAVRCDAGTVAARGGRAQDQQSLHVVVDPISIYPSPSPSSEDSLCHRDDTSTSSTDDSYHSPRDLHAAPADVSDLRHHDNNRDGRHCLYSNQRTPEQLSWSSRRPCLPSPQTSPEPEVAEDERSTPSPKRRRSDGDDDSRFELPARLRRSYVDNVVTRGRHEYVRCHKEAKGPLAAIHQANGGANGHVGRGGSVEPPSPTPSTPTSPLPPTAFWQSPLVAGMGMGLSMAMHHPYLALSFQRLQQLHMRAAQEGMAAGHKPAPFHYPHLTPVPNSSHPSHQQSPTSPFQGRFMPLSGVPGQRVPLSIPQTTSTSNAPNSKMPPVSPVQVQSPEYPYQAQLRNSEFMPRPSAKQNVPVVLPPQLQVHQSAASPSSQIRSVDAIPLDLDTKTAAEKRKRREGEPPRYNCDACGKTYSTFSGLSKHKQFHCTSHIQKQFNCKYCDKTYVSLGALKMHIRTHTLPCKCHICGKAFSRPWLLQGHVRTHTGEKPFQCAHCGRSFADRSNLRAHLQTHSDVKKYSCRTCSKTFSRMSLLLKHEDGGCAGMTH